MKSEHPLIRIVNTFWGRGPENLLYVNTLDNDNNASISQHENNLVVNLSKHTLSSAQHTLLKRGCSSALILKN